MIEILLNKLSKTDSAFENIIQRFLQESYFPPGNLPEFTTFLPKSIKLIAYFFVLSLILSLFKILHPENRIITLVLISVLIITGTLLILIFLGFMQLLYE